MSSTDNTRPIEVQEADRGTLWVMTVPNFPVAVIGGFAGAKRYGKQMRRNDASKRRQRDRKVKHNARYMRDKEAVDVLPIRADRRTLRAA